MKNVFRKIALGILIVLSFSLLFVQGWGSEEGERAFYIALFAYFGGVYIATRGANQKLRDLKRRGYLSKKYDDADYEDMKEKEEDMKLPEWLKRDIIDTTKFSRWNPLFYLDVLARKSPWAIYFFAIVFLILFWGMQEDKFAASVYLVLVAIVCFYLSTKGD